MGAHVFNITAYLQRRVSTGVGRCKRVTGLGKNGVIARERDNWSLRALSPSGVNAILSGVGNHFVCTKSISQSRSPRRRSSLCEATSRLPRHLAHKKPATFPNDLSRFACLLCVCFLLFFAASLVAGRGGGRKIESPLDRPRARAGNVHDRGAVRKCHVLLGHFVSFVAEVSLQSQWDRLVCRRNLRCCTTCMCC